MKRIALFVALVVVVLSLSVLPAFAGGDQVHRPDSAGSFSHDGLHADGDSPFADFQFGQ